MRGTFHTVWRRGPWLALTALGLLAALILAGCGGGGAPAGGGGGGGAQQVTVKGSEFKFDPSTVTVKANQPVHLTFQNTGSTKHDWAVKDMTPQVSVVADAGKSATVDFTPTKAGTFEVVCSQPGHEDAGMKGQLVVQ